MARSVGIRELKDNLSALIEEVQAGTAITVTVRNRPVARIIPFPDHELEARLLGMVAEGRARWGGGRPGGTPEPESVEGAAVAEAVIEDRR